jgi:RNA polymerase sigma factor (sigma-70 family)
MTEDSELLRRYAESRSEEAFAELVQRRVGLVYSVALRHTHDRQRAEDVTQAVFTALARKAPTLTERPVLIGWLYRSAQYVASDVVRGERRRQVREQEAHTMDEIFHDGTEPDWDKLRPLLDDVLGEMDDRDRDAVLLRFFEGCPFAEIGAKLRLTENAARMRVDRAIEKMRTRLSRRGVTSTAVALGLALANQVSAAVPAGLAASVTAVALANAAVSAGAAGASTVTVLHFLTTHKLIATTVAALVLVALGSAVRQTRVAHESAETLAVVSQERDDLRARLAALEKNASATTRDPLAAPLSGGNGLAPFAAPRSRSRDASLAQPSGWRTTSPIDRALESPEARPSFVQQEVLNVQRKFDRFFKVAGLSEREQEAFLNLMKDFAEAKVDLTAEARAQGYGPRNPPPDPAVLQELFKSDYKVEAVYMEKFRALLGDERYRQFVDFRGVIPEVNVADELAAQLYDTDHPLTAQQASELVRVLKEHRYRSGSAPAPTNTFNGAFISDATQQASLTESNLTNGNITLPALDWRAPITDAAIARAAGVLTSSQLAALRQLQARQVVQFALAPAIAPGATPR